MSEYVVEQFPLAEGLNLHDPQSLLAPGFLSECLNFEIVSAYSGLKLVDGYEPFLGNSQPFSHLNWYSARQFSGASTDMPLGNVMVPYANWANDIAYIGGPIYDGNPLAVTRNLVGLYLGNFSAGGVRYIRMQVKDLDILDTTFSSKDFFGATSPAVSRTYLNPVAVNSSTLNPDNFPYLASASYANPNNALPVIAASPAASYTTKMTHAQKLRDHAKDLYVSMGTYAGQLPQEALGLHWFEDNLFAVAPYQYLPVTLTGGGPLNVVAGDYMTFVPNSPSNWPHRYAVGSAGPQSLIAVGGESLIARVIYVDPNNEYIYIEPTGAMSVTSSDVTKRHPVYHLDSVRNWQVPVTASFTAITRTDNLGGSPVGVNFTIGNAFPVERQDIKCGVFIARSLEQSLAINNNLSRAGWSPITQSWVVPATNMTMADGKLVKFKSGVAAAGQQTSEAPGATTGAFGYDAVDPNAAVNKGNPSFITTGHSQLPATVPNQAYTPIPEDGLGGNHLNLNSSSNIFWADRTPSGVEASPPYRFDREYVSGALTGSQWVGLPLWRRIDLAAATAPSARFRSGVINFGGFGALDTEIPDTASIRGIEVTVRYSVHMAGGFGTGQSDNLDATESISLSLDATLSSVSQYLVAPHDRVDTLFGQTRSEQITSTEAATHARWAAGTITSATFGGPSDMWGNTALTKASVVSALQGVSLQASGLVTTADAAASVVLARQLKIHEVVMKVHYVLPSVRYYFYNITDNNFVRGDLVDYTVTAGSLAGADAAVNLQLTTVTAEGAGTRYRIKSGDDIYTSAAVGTPIGRVSANMAPVMFPSENELIAEESKYQFIDANFYGNLEQSVVYGVSGAGRGFAFDSNYSQYIYANIDDENLDKPRHVAEYEGQLCLGYKYGALFFSDVGEPTTFTGIAGAAVVAVGQRITGLTTLVGGTLGVFCDSSVRSISGATPDYVMKTVAPSGGAIEYSLVDIGSPVYSSQAGITTLDQTEKFGDFYGSTLSEAVNSWLLPRLTTKAAAASGSSANSRQVIAAIPCRKKAQYKLFFEDGNVLTMTLVGPNKEPKFTFQKYFIDQRSLFPQLAIVPRAFSSQIDSSGKERIHVSYDRGRISPYFPYAYGQTNHFGAVRQVYDVVELDVGWTFHFTPILDAYVVVSANYMQSPFEYGTLRKIRVEGQHQGYDNLLAYAYSDYRPYTEFNANPKLTNMNLFEETNRSIVEDYRKGSKIEDLPANGRFFKLVLVANSQLKYGSTLTPSLGIVMQSVNAQYEKGKPDA